MTKLLDKYIIKIEKSKEEKRLAILEKAQNALGILSKEISFKKAYIFGSILRRKKFYYDSDVDIAVYGLKDNNSSTLNIYHNTIKIYGTGSGTSFTAAHYRFNGGHCQNDKKTR